MFIGIRQHVPRTVFRSMVPVLFAFTLYVLLTVFDLDYKTLSQRSFSSSAGSNNSNSWSSSSSSSHSASSDAFNYQVAIAYQPKDRNEPIYAKLKESLQSPTGEDSYFVAPRSNSELYAGVADGIGGWANHGYDSTAISRELCLAMKSITLNSSKDIAPKELLQMAFSSLINEKKVEVGGTTAIVAHLKDDGTLNVSNLGDSWCGVFRDCKLTFETKFQTVGFNAPYQLAIIPKHIIEAAEKKNGSFIMNKPTDADDYSFKLQKNDIVVLATDGVTDNIAVEDMELFLKDKIESSQSLQDITEEFVDKVVTISKDPTFPSVFSQEYSKLAGQYYSGGKEDDITVVVIKVE
ncbi:Ptc7 [Kluyveromyces lactis]|nr:Ptc7 [Kluyveromyces lactis]